MVDTTRLEKLLGSTPGAGARRVSGGAGSAPRGMALSGHPSQRRDPGPRAISAQRQAALDTNWNGLKAFQRDPTPDTAIRQFNKQARAPDVVSLFDVLRTQLAQTFAARQIRTLGITAPGSGTGTSFVTAGLLASFARRDEHRVIGLDLNTAQPALHRYFELASSEPINAYISGALGPYDHLVKITNRVAVGLGAPAEDDMPQTLSDQDLQETIEELVSDFLPDLIICDLPPLLQGDGAIALLPKMDATLLVASAQATSSANIMACERLMDGKTEFLGVVMNDMHTTFHKRPNG